MNAFERREQIIERMKIRKFDNILNLANEFEVSRRTIINDIQELSCNGYPIQANTGRDGGIRWMGSRKHFPFNERERIALQNAIALVTQEDKLVLEKLLCENERATININDIFEILATGKTQRTLAFELCISESHLSRVLSRKKKPSEELVERIIKLKEGDESGGEVVNLR